MAPGLVPGSRSGRGGAGSSGRTGGCCRRGPGVGTWRPGSRGLKEPQRDPAGGAGPGHPGFGPLRWDRCQFGPGDRHPRHRRGHGPGGATCAGGAALGAGAGRSGRPPHAATGDASRRRGERGRQDPLHFLRVHRCQGLSGPAHAASPPAVPGIWMGSERRLRHPRAHGGAPDPRAHAPSPQELRWRPASPGPAGHEPVAQLVEQRTFNP